MDPVTPAFALYLGGVFLLAGIVKGLLGVGTPMVAVPLLALVMPTPKAISLMVVPTFASNVWQAIDSGHVREALARFWPLIAALATSTAITARVMLGLPLRVIDITVAGSLLLAVGVMSWKPRIGWRPSNELAWSLVVGTLSGVLGGASSLMGPLIIVYLLALGLTADRFVGTISVVYLAGAIPLYGALALYDVLAGPELLASVLVMLPMFVGMSIGKRLRRRVSERGFRSALLVFLTVVAIVLITRAVRGG